MMMSLFYVAAL